VTKRKVLLVGIDGLRIDDALAARSADGAPVAPALAALVGAGVLLPMRMELPTISGPGWSSILTGATHAEHGVFDNSFHGHTLTRNADLLSRAYFADQSRTTFAASSWPPITDPAGPGPIVAARPDEARRGVHRSVVRDGELYGYRWADGEIAATARFWIRYAEPDVSFVYLGEVDEAGHLYGGTSDEYTAAIARVDGLLAEVERRTTSASTAGASTAGGAEAEAWTVAVTTDHGHLDEGGHGGGEDVLRRSFLAMRTYGADAPALPERTSIEPWEIVPTLLERL
jgi:predicted AlkP superfamily pyrophosphatase or phosphodiesterase